MFGSVTGRFTMPKTGASLAIALANKLARIAWAVLNKERKFECIRTNKMASQAA
jgi:hypothetical protein